MRRRRNGPDDRLRRLEREAATGDEQARLTLLRERQRSGQPVSARDARSLREAIALGVVVAMDQLVGANSAAVGASFGTPYVGEGEELFGQWWVHMHPDVARAQPGILVAGSIYEGPHVTWIPRHGQEYLGKPGYWAWLVTFDPGASSAMHERLRELRRRYEVEEHVRPGQEGTLTTEPRLVCAWCEVVLRNGPLSASHGICPPCRAEALAEYAQERENPPDDRLRALERAAAQGDYDAMTALSVERMRAGHRMPDAWSVIAKSPPKGKRWPDDTRRKGALASWTTHSNDPDNPYHHEQQARATAWAAELSARTQSMMGWTPVLDVVPIFAPAQLTSGCIDRQNVEGLRHGQALFHVFMRRRDGDPLRVVVSGSVKTWKRDPDRFEFPIKSGLYDHARVASRYWGTENIGNPSNWRLTREEALAQTPCPGWTPPCSVHGCQQPARNEGRCWSHSQGHL